MKLQGSLLELAKLILFPIQVEYSPTILCSFRIDPLKKHFLQLCLVAGSRRLRYPWFLSAQPIFLPAFFSAHLGGRGLHFYSLNSTMRDGLINWVRPSHQKEEVFLRTDKGGKTANIVLSGHCKATRNSSDIHVRF